MNLADRDDLADADPDPDPRLRRSAALGRLAGALARVGGWALEADGSVYWSQEVYRILEVPPGEAPDMDAAMAQYPPPHRERLVEALRRCRREGAPFDLELDVDTYAGRRLPVRVIGEAELDDDGRVVRVIGAIQDISDLRRATEQTESAVRRLTTTLESMTDALYTVDRTWTFTYLNQRAGDLLRRDRLALVGSNLWEEFPATVDTELYHAFHRALATGRTETLDAVYLAPLDLWLAITAYPSEQGLTVHFRDVSEQRATRERLEQQARLLDEAHDAIVVHDLDGRVTAWNRGAERLYGFSAEEACDADVGPLIGLEPSVAAAAGAEVLATGTFSGEVEVRTRSGERRIVDTRWNLLHDEDGSPRAVFSIDADVTERKRIEQQLLRAQRTESIGTLASGIAHDLNNVLAPILLASELLRDLDPTDMQQELLTTIMTSARRGADLVAQVLSFARGVEGERQPVDVVALLRDIAAIVRDTFPKDVRFELYVPERASRTLGDSTQIQQVLLNLAVNARDAMPDGGRLVAVLSEVDLEVRDLVGAPDAAPGRHLLIEVEDDGVGMTPEVLERVFEPFFTTKPAGAGTGLGLSTAAAIVRSHGGVLNAYSEPGRGSRFRIYLPVVAGAARRADAVEATTSTLPSGEGHTVLVVDDEPALRNVTRQTLGSAGYEVLEASDGAEAVAVFVEHRDRITVVLTDMTMPVMDGPATIHALRRLDPDVPIIGASGLESNGKVAQATNAGIDHFLPKPFSGRHLLELLASVLGEP